MTFNIQLKKEDSIYEAYLTYINPIFADKQLTDLEIKLLGTFMGIKNKYKHLDGERLNKLLFHKDTKKRIREYLNIKEAVFNNTTKSLRDKNFFKYDRMLIPLPEIKDNKLVINFVLSKNEK